MSRLLYRLTFFTQSKQNVNAENGTAVLSISHKYLQRVVRENRNVNVYFKLIATTKKLSVSIWLHFK